MKPLLLAALAVPATVATVHGVQHGHGQDMMAHVHGMIAQRLELTPEQKEAAHRVIQAHHANLHTKAKAAFETRADVLQVLVDAQTTPDQIRLLEVKASAATLDLELEVNQIIREISPSLTEVQRGKLKQMVADLRAHVEAFHAHGSKEKAHS